MKNPPNLKIATESSGRPSPALQPLSTHTSNIQAPLRAINAMTSLRPAERVSCTFPGCNFEFDSVAAMKLHKERYPDHEYCRKCDLDFMSEEQLLIHKIKSKDHTVCPVCAIEYRSEGGRDSHIRQFHRTAQNLVCPGCKLTFRSASGLMRHIENGECRIISQEELRYEQNKRLMLKETLELSSPSGLRIHGGSVVDDDYEQGGVSLPVDLLCEENIQAMANQPMYGKGSADKELAAKHWPSLKQKENETGLEEDIRDLMTFTDAEPKEDKEEETSNAWKDRGRVPTVVGTELTYQTQPASVSTPSATGARTDAATHLRRMYAEWKPEKYIDQYTDEYVCPCGKRFKSKKGFEQHLLAKNKSIRRVQCPGCLRNFKSTAALIAHCESSTTRCDVNEGNMYAQIIDEVSGGMIQMAGLNEDGTLKYEGGKVKIQEKVTIGVKW
ncbi:hypothetical protein ASPCAL11988 [Aspergillus calidoustus]|uniref:C2H2-type domain-containing protein n=1 Tax=Aspergillus calidoustus TaxID=454130 RepID=A0A0U5GAX7_ASPCI|nr:hypothetical protein ASPCAL11988 [Aspergillus calidoustus]